MMQAGLLGAGLGVAGLASTFFGQKKTIDTLKKSDKYPFLDPVSASALEDNPILDDFVDRLLPYFHYDREICHAYAEAAAGAAEFLLRKDEIQHKRSIPLQFRAFTHVMRTRLRELRRIIREETPSILEEFDEIRNELDAFHADNHHNLWCEAHF